MKKNALSLLLILVVILSLTLAACGGNNNTTNETTAPNVQDDNTTGAPVVSNHDAHCVCAGKYEGDAAHHTCQDLTDWIPLTADRLAMMETHTGQVDVVADVTMTLIPTGNYYLTGDLELVNSISNAKDADVVICLNGFKLSGNSTLDSTTDFGSANSRIVNQVRGGSLSFTDCSAENTGTIESKGVKAQTAPIALINNEGAVLNLYAGTIIGGETASKAAGAIRSLTGTQGVFNMYGGTISGGVAGGNGGNIAIYSPMNMYGGTISGGDGGKGGNIYLGNAKSDVKIYGGTIGGGTIAMGLQSNDIWVNAGKLTIINLDADCQIKVNKENAEVDLSQMDSSLSRVDDATVAENLSASFVLKKAAAANP